MIRNLVPSRAMVRAFAWLAAAVGASFSPARAEEFGVLEADWAAFKDIVASNYWRPADMLSLHKTCEAAAELTLATPSSTNMSHEACVGAALRVLEKRTRYITAEESRAMDKEPRKYVGIALELSRPREPGPIHIVQPIPGGPGERAGLMPGDDVYSIDGVDVTSSALRESIALFRGEPGTPVTLLVGRGDRRDLKFTIVREEIHVRRGRFAFLQRERALWIRVTQFLGDVRLDLAKGLQEAVGLSPVRPRMIVLDLRGSVGGLLDEAVSSAALFLPPGTAVYSERSQASMTVRRLPTAIDAELSARISPTLLNELQHLPLTVLVDERTASGSEMFAMAMKEMRRARVVGAATSGDNSISRMLRLPSGARVELPIAKMSSPSGVSWEGTGIPLDELRTERASEYGDPRVDKLLAHVVSY